MQNCCENESYGLEGLQSARDRLDKLRERVFYDLGIRLPNALFETDLDLEETAALCHLNCLRTPIQEVLSLNQPDSHVWNVPDLLDSMVLRSLRENASVFLTTSQVEFALGLLFESFSSLVPRVLEKFSVADLTRILRLLLDEQVSIRDFPSLLEALLLQRKTVQFDPNDRRVIFPNDGGRLLLHSDKKSPTIRDYAEYLRLTMRSSISLKHAGGGRIIPAYCLSEQIRRRLRASERNPLSEQERDDLHKTILDLLEHWTNRDRFPVILTTFEVRRVLRDLIAKEFPFIGVMSNQEVAAGFDIQPLFEINSERFETSSPP